MVDIRRTLYINLGITLAITLIVLLLASLTLGRFQSRLEQMATTDHVTGLLNRQAFDILLQQSVNENRRNWQPMAVIMLDIDHFKAVNDKYGHPAGDRIIREVAGTLRAGLRESDIAGRWGGEEFLLLLKGCDGSAAAAIAEKLRLSVAKNIRADVNAPQIRITVSVGVAPFVADDTAENIIARADQALYRAKREGRDRVALAAAPV